MAKSRKARKNQPSHQKKQPQVKTKSTPETQVLEKKAEKAPVSKTTPKKQATTSADSAMPFGQMNYFIMIAGVLLLLVGFYIMASDKETFGFGFYGLTLGPIIVFVSFMIQFFAIFYKKKD